MEQPCATVEELAELRRRLGARGMLVRVAADELSARRATNPLAVVQARASMSLCSRLRRWAGCRRYVASPRRSDATASP